MEAPLSELPAMIPEHETVFRAISNLNEGSIDDRSAAWKELVDKEERVLRTVDRVVNDSRDQALKGTSLMHMSLASAFRAFTAALPVMLQDALDSRTPADVATALLSKERKIWAGLLLIVAAAFVFFASAT